MLLYEISKAHSPKGKHEEFIFFVRYQQLGVFSSEIKACIYRLLSISGALPTDKYPSYCQTSASYYDLLACRKCGHSVLSTVE